MTASPGGNTATSTVVIGLANGTSYTFAITATNAVGTGASSTSSNAVTPATTPDAPQNVSAIAGDGVATVTWEVPASDGGTIITGYTVISDPDTVAVEVVSTSTATTTIVTGLQNGTEYTFTVTATNDVGIGTSSAASNAVTPATDPDAPTNVIAVGGNGQASVTWNAPAFNGGIVITLYIVTSSPDGIMAMSSTTTITVVGLTNGTSYTFSVIATNSVGSSTSSAPSNAVTPQSVPDAPTGVSATAGFGHAVISWSPPIDDGGFAITLYTVTSIPDGLGSTTTATTTTVTGLTFGTSYVFTVTATNVIGDSPPSTTSNAVIPFITITGTVALQGVSSTTAFSLIGPMSP